MDPKGWSFGLPSGYVNRKLLKMAIEIVDFPMKNGDPMEGVVHCPFSEHMKVRPSGDVCLSWNLDAIPKQDVTQYNAIAPILSHREVPARPVASCQTIAWIVCPRKLSRKL